ncbi:MAG: cyclic pyranopterin monophosphate synthase MoaC [Candidatus Thermoplasmatota archaeon]
MAKVPDHSAVTPLRRMAVARGTLALRPATCKALESEGAELLATGKVAAIVAAKRAGTDVPTALGVHLTDAFCDLSVEDSQVVCTMTVQAVARQTLEAHALAGCAAALLALWDAAKAMEQDADGNFPAAKVTGLGVVQNVVL